nr:uncharacterized protein LOC111130369 isoform X3 [Crassostrea virginica]XP_022333087.1 uncharacterized protein LOC111130369 isoform X3 [Crassostrea virginica]XP_022333088.1 uncharacterized protein LOC111130369 isoform X3 [Crassostrea virginica]XP_022333090.1 uncharacterized protein LOC111130369 isoform X3 [Crassostrea virginica]XP_022333091.1 uncharacterized protein LOC111130369 isoform X3 [Crassostrea virginica]
MAEEYNTDSISGREVHVNDTSTHRQGNTENEIVGYLKKFDGEFKKIKITLRTLKRNQEAIQKQLKKQNVHHRPTFKQQLPRLTLPESSVDECIHGEVIQLHMKTLVREVDVEFIIDDMIEKGLLNDVEKNEIEDTKKVHKTRQLAAILARNDKGNFKKFLEVISQENYYPHVAKLLNESYDEKLREMEKHIACIRCFIVQKVDIKQIMDHLCENLLICMTDVEKVIQDGKGTKQEFWGKIFEKISDPVWGETSVTILKEALQENYNHIAKKIHCQNNLKCHCPSSSMSCKTGSVGNVSEVSTTSIVIPDSKPETHEWIKRHTRPILESKPTKKEYIWTSRRSKYSEDEDNFFNVAHRRAVSDRACVSHFPEPRIRRNKEPDTSFHAN